MHCAKHRGAKRDFALCPVGAPQGDVLVHSGWENSVNMPSVLANTSTEHSQEYTLLFQKREIRDFAGPLGDTPKITLRSGSPKPHPSIKPHPCNMQQAKTEVALQFSECCAAEVALQHSLFCSAEVIFTKSCAATMPTSEKLQCNIEKAALQESGAFLPLSCGFHAPTFRHPSLGPADTKVMLGAR